jgi:hypothetical protein
MAIVPVRLAVQVEKFVDVGREPVAKPETSTVPAYFRGDLSVSPPPSSCGGSLIPRLASA